MVWWYASSLFPPHATAVDLCNRDRNPGIDDVPSGAAPYNVTRLAQNSCRLQPESRSIIGHNMRPSLLPQRSHLQSARVILPSGYFTSTRPALYFFFCNGLRNSVTAAERIQLRNAFWLKFLASFRARLTDSKHAPSWVSNSFLFQIFKRYVGSDW